MLTNVSTPDQLGRVQHRLGADDVGLHRLGGVLLEHRQVLERRRVEDHLGTSRREDLVQSSAVPDVAQDDLVGVEQGPPVDRQLDRVEGRLVAVEHHQLGRFEAVDLAAQLRADRAAGSGHQDATAGEVVGDRLDVGVELVAAQHVGQVDVADVADADVLGEQLGRRRQHLDVEPGLHGRAPHPADGLRVGAGDRDDRAVGSGRLDRITQVGRGAEDRNTAEPPVPLVGVVVQDPDRVPLGVRVAQHRADQLATGLPAPDEQDLRPALVAKRLVTALVQPAPDGAAPGRDH